MPAMRSLLGRLFPAAFGSTEEASTRRHTSSQKKIRTADSGPNTSFVQLIEMDQAENLKRHSNT